MCKECQRAYLKGHYARNRPYYLAKARRLNARRWAELKGLLHELKSRPCTDYGLTYPPWIMEFDHVRGTKDFTVSTNLRSRTPAALRREAAKCEVVCANCHRNRTYLRIVDEIRRSRETSVALGEDWLGMSVARPDGIEPPTSTSVAWRSIR